MHATIKTGGKEGFVSSYSLVFENGLQLRADCSVFEGREERKRIRLKFCEVVVALRNAGIPIAGDIET